MGKGREREVHEVGSVEQEVEFPLEWDTICDEMGEPWNTPAE